MTLCNMNKIEFKNRLHKGIKPIIEKKTCKHNMLKTLKGNTNTMISNSSKVAN